MSNFQLSPKIDSNKIFLVRRNELKGRLDPYFHKPEFNNIQKRIISSDWYVSKLKDLFQINRGGSPRPIQKYLTKENNGFNWIKIGDTKGVDKYIYKTKQKIKPEGAKYSRQVFEDDFILSNSMSFGKPFIMRTTGYIHDGWLLFRSITDKASKDYLHTVLGTNFVYQLFKQQTIGGVVENLNIDLVKNIKIPIPPKEVQAEIVDKIDAAYNSKKKKEAEAQRLIDSIDNYLLTELGIKLPQQKENTIHSRIFTRQLSEVSSGRLDVEYYQNKYINNELYLLQGRYKVAKLGTLLHLLESGSRPSGGVGNIFEGILSFGGTHVHQDGDIDLSNPKYIPFEYHEKHSNTSTLINDLLLVKDGATTGKIGIIKDIRHENQNINEHVFLIRVKNKEINPIYLFSYLKSLSGNTQINRQITGATVTGLIKNVVSNLKIPLPPIDKQNEIADHINTIRAQAKALQQEAKEQLEQAKKEVEVMILGEDNKN